MEYAHRTEFFTELSLSKSSMYISRDEGLNIALNEEVYMEQKVDPAKVMDLSRQLKTLSSAVENHSIGVHREIQRLVDNTRKDYSEAYVRQAAGQVDQLLSEMKRIMDQLFGSMEKKEADLKWAAEQYRKAEAEAKAKTKQSLSSKFGVMKWTFTQLTERASELRQQMMDTYINLLRNPPTLMDMVKALVNQAKDFSLERRLKPFQEDERIASLLDILHTGEEKDQIWAREELEKISAAFGEISKSQVAYRVYQAYGRQGYMDEARAEAERQRNLLAGLGVDSKWYGPGVDLRVHFKGSPSTACKYNPLLTDGSPMPKESELVLVVEIGMLDGKYRSWAEANYPQIETAVKKMIQERKERERQIEEYNREISSEDIEKVQEYLKKQELYFGEVNGKYDEEFLEAMKTYQQLSGNTQPDGKIDAQLVQLVENSKEAGWLTPVGVAEGVVRQVGDDAVDTVTGIINFVPQSYTLAKAICNGEISFEDIKNSIGESLAEEYKEPFKTLDRLSWKVMNGDATYAQCVEYGRAVTKVAQVFLVALSAGKAGIKLSSSAMQKLKKVLPEIADTLKKQPVGMTEHGFNMTIPDTKVPDIRIEQNDTQKNFWKVIHEERQGIEGKGEIPKSVIEKEKWLGSLQNTDNFKQGTKENGLNHIFDGEILKNGNANGFHYEGMPNSNGKIVGNVDPPNEFGVYQANVEINGVLKGPKSTFFPKEWTPQQVIDSVNEAFNNKVNIKNNKYIGKTSTGMEIEFILRNDKIISAYPIY
ncbi:hypothetical protein DCC85_19110 [Paenibacillus sp. CAA11]|nr:hypothetical protein DCC85_19110 [Paenibacillus sp. CAA11]